MPAKTKKDLEDENKMLRGKLKELKEKLEQNIATQSEEVGTNPKLALGLYKDGTDYKIVRIQYDPEKQVAKFESSTDASKNPLSPDLAKFSFEELVSEEIFGKL
jgi:hypothetical protein